MNAHDELLLWASERGSGQVAELRAAASWLLPDVVAGEVINDLQCLGHLEVVEGRWRVASSLLTILPNGGGNGVMTGSRPAWLVDTFAALDDDPDPDVAALGDHVWENVCVPQVGPSSWFIALGSEASRATLAEMGVAVVDDISDALLDHVTRHGAEPVGRTVRPGEVVARAVPVGGTVCTAPEWQPVRGDAEPGSYLYLRNNRRVYAIRDGSGWREVGLRWAEWAALLPSARALWASPRDAHFYTPQDLRLPLVLERAVVLRTGRLPEHLVLPDTQGKKPPVRRYTNVPYPVAERVAALLGTELILV